jgi:hypothetical protein
MKRSTTHLLTFLALVLIILIPQNGIPCGPSFANAVFTFQRHPDAPLKRYAQGKLGVVLPSFARSYLVIAYRHLSGRSLSSSETTGILNYWRWKLTGGRWSIPQDPNEEWLGIRELVLGKQENTPAFQYKDLSSDGQYVTIGEFQNCGPESFHTAARTLNNRIRRFGRHSPAVREWLKGQDAVFSNCNRPGTIPALLTTNTSPLLRADRRYQIAAAHFYAGDHLTAAREFDKIAQEKGSPWHLVAPYMAARAMVRDASLDQSSDSLDKAEARLRAILRDENQKQLHRAARRLLSYIAFRRDPEKRTHELGKLIAVRRIEPEFQQNMIDYTFGLDRALESSPAFPAQDDPAANVLSKKEKWEEKRYQDLKEFASEDKMTDWIMTFQQPGESATKHAAARWQKQHSLPWLVAAISKVKAGNSLVAQLTEAAAQIPSSSPAYPSLTFHRVRLLMDAGENEKARQLVDEFLSAFTGNLSPSSLNLFLEKKLKLAKSFDDFVAYAARRSVGEDSWGDDVGDEWLNCTWDDKGCGELVFGSQKIAKQDRRFDRTAALTLNLRMPLDLLQQAVLSSQLPAPLRGELAVSTWTRAVMLGQYEIADTVLPAAKAAYPDTSKNLDAYSAADRTNKRHAALFTILHFPGMRPYVNARSGRETAIAKIDNFRDNWWCDDVGAKVEEPNYARPFLVTIQIIK